MNFPNNKYGDASELVYREVIRAKGKFPAFKSPHEGYAVVLEELDEAWYEIKHGSLEKAITEMTQVAAMATAFVAEFTEELRKRETALEVQQRILPHR